MITDSHLEPPTTDLGARRSRLWHRAAARRIGLAAAVACGLLAGRAGANEVARAESLSCADFACADTLEFKCTQASSMICFDVEANGGNEPVAQVFSASAVAIAPTAMLGKARVISLVAGTEGSFCLSRPGVPGTMKVLLTIAASGSPPTVGHYTARGECFAGNILDGLETKKTVLTVKQDQ